MRSFSGHLFVVALASFWLAACGSSSPTLVRHAVTQPFFITNGCSYISTTLGGVQQICLYELPNVVEGVPFSLGLLSDAGPVNSTVPIQATGITPPVSFQLTPGTTLPPGLSFNTSGVIKGIPTLPGTYNFGVVAVDSSNPTPKLSNSATFTLTVLPAGALLRQVGHSNLGGIGQNADVTVHGSFAFVGTRGVPGSCPNNGVKIVDLSDPTNPQVAAVLPDVSSGSYQPEAKVATVDSPAFHGDLMAVAVRPCDPANDNNAGDRGVALYDVTTPSSPRFLSFWQAGIQGVGDVAIVPKPDTANAANSKIYVLAAVPGSESLDPNHQGDLRVLDVSAPANPVQVAQWGILRALNIDPTQVKVGQDQRIFLDSINLSSDGTKAFLAYWDEGVVIMDVSTPAAIADSTPNIALSHVVYPTVLAASSDHFSSPEGNTHEALPVAGDTGMMVSDKVCASQKIPNPANPATTVSANPATQVVCGTDVDLTATTGWGFLRTYTLPALTQPAAAGGVVLATGESDPPPDHGIYTPNNLAWNGSLQDPHGYVAWFSNGVVDVDLSSLSAPAVLGAFVPPATPDPQGADPTKNNPDQPLVFGVAPYTQTSRQYIVASDVNSGLWVLQETSAPEFAILTTSLPAGTTAVAYTAQLVAANGTAPITWRQSAGTMPPGLKLETNGLIDGVPVPGSAGTYTFSVQARNLLGGGQIVTQQYSITINSNFTIATAQLPTGTLNESYSVSLAAVNGSGALTWSVLSGNLPAGMTLASTGNLTGTPAQGGTFNVTIGVSDASNPPLTTSHSYTLDVAPFSFTTASHLGDGAVGGSYTGGLSLLNGTSPFTFVVTNGALPPGLSLTTGTGVFSGAATTAGTYVFTVQVTDADSQTTSRQFTLTIDPFSLGTTSLPQGTVGQGYYAPIQLNHGQAPFTFALATGTLPAGLTLSAENPDGTPGAAAGNVGVIAGVPTTPGTSTFTVQVRDTDGNLATLQYTLTIQP